MNLRVISNESDFFELKDIWTQVFETSGIKHIFASWEWCFYWWKYFGGHKKLFIILVEERGTVIGIAPLMLNRGGIRTMWRPVLQFIGSDMADYSDFIISSEPKAVLSTICDYVCTEIKWAIWDFGNIREDSENLKFLRDILSKSKVPIIDRFFCFSPIVQINGSWDTYYKSISKGLKQDIRTALNKMLLKGNVNFKIYRDLPNSTILNRIFEIHRARQTGKVGLSLFEKEEKRSFISDICATLGQRGWLHLSVLKLNEEIISYALGFNFKGFVYYWNVAFHPDLAKMSPGKVLIKCILEDSFQNKETEFDFMLGEELYKLQWCTAKRANFIIRVYSSHILYWIEIIWNKLKQLVVTLKKIRFFQNIRLYLSKIHIPLRRK